MAAIGLCDTKTPSHRSECAVDVAQVTEEAHTESLTQGNDTVEVTGGRDEGPNQRWTKHSQPEELVCLLPDKCLSAPVLSQTAGCCDQEILSTSAAPPSFWSRRMDSTGRDVPQSQTPSVEFRSTTIRKIVAACLCRCPGFV